MNEKKLDLQYGIVRDYVVELLLVIDDRIVDDDSDAVDTELTLACGDDVEIKLLRINV